jgi:hypothetical protein
MRADQTKKNPRMLARALPGFASTQAEKASHFPLPGRGLEQLPALLQVDRTANVIRRVVCLRREAAGTGRAQRADHAFGADVDERGG